MSSLIVPAESYIEDSENHAVRKLVPSNKTQHNLQAHVISHRVFGTDLSNNLNISNPQIVAKRLKSIRVHSKQYCSVNQDGIYGRSKSVTRATGRQIVLNTSRNANALSLSNYKLSGTKSKIQKFRESLETSLASLNPIDRSNYPKPLECGEYAEEIFNNLKDLEKNTIFAIPTDYMENIQPDINEKMRAILLDWLVEVHLKFRLNTETLFLTSHLIDRFLSKEPIKRENLQLVGVSSLFIASKYEEIYAPELKDFAYITDNTYTKKQIKEMEVKILNKLDFRIAYPSSFRFLQRYHKLLGGNDLGFNLGRYLIELALLDYKMLKYSNSLLASAAIYVSQKILREKETWNELLQKQTQYSKKDLKACANDYCLLLKSFEKSQLQAVRKKFATKVTPRIKMGI